MNNNQRNPQWANIPVGSGEQTIGQVGCTISVIGDILGLTPDVVNEKLKAVNGFADQNLIIWSKIEEAFPGVKITRVWSYNNDDVKAHIPNVIVEVPANPIGGRGSHWVNYIGNQELKDPWTGTVRPTSDFPNPTGYCVIIPPVTEGETSSNCLIPNTPEWQKKYEELVTKSTGYEAVCDTFKQPHTTSKDDIVHMITALQNIILSTPEATKPITQAAQPPAVEASASSETVQLPVLPVLPEVLQNQPNLKQYGSSDPIATIVSLVSSIYNRLFS